MKHKTSAIVPNVMGNIRIKQQGNSPKKNKLGSKFMNTGGKFVLSDVSREELQKRRIPVYPYLM
ncbi:hypothetical protein [Bacteroides pyogenes]|uniref:hypothetical protein n=1 Tax=Bacteroides pyogenes TaxID=310300 RepID=UPI001BA9C160|nr:hypothetical protein [Bacteroides pyogenes]